MSTPSTLSGRQLWELLPVVYRGRDRDGDLADYLDACGELLDQVRETLEQRLADAFPDRPPEGLAAQGWVLPYLAELVDARLLSPHLDGRRQEVEKAVAWRQRKGTVGCLEQIVEAVARVEVEVHEGWQRLALTPRVGLPLAPDDTLGRLDMDNPPDAARHPQLPAVTPDFRRAVETRDVAAAGQAPGWRFRYFPARVLERPPAAGQTPGSDTWFHPHRHGAPRFPGSYEDLSHRTVDLRAPAPRRGLYHPRRLLFFTAPATGFFPPDRRQVGWQQGLSEELFKDKVDDATGVRRIWKLDPLAPDGSDNAITLIVPVGVRFDGGLIRIEDLCFLDPPENDRTIEITGGRLELRRVAARRVVVTGGDAPALDAADCLFETVDAGAGLARLEHCTVLGDLACGRLQASDCIFGGAVTFNSGAPGTDSCVRYSRIPKELAQSKPEEVRWPANTIDQPAFFDFEICDRGEVRRSREFGQPGCGVLHPATPESIRFGAEDGGEMGAYHHRRYALQDAAVREKLRDFLPLGLEAALIPDPRLLASPPGIAPAAPAAPALQDIPSGEEMT